jgi:hypothetical protein
MIFLSPCGYQISCRNNRCCGLEPRRGGVPPPAGPCPGPWFPPLGPRAGPAHRRPRLVLDRGGRGTARRRAPLLCRMLRRRYLLHAARAAASAPRFVAAGNRGGLHLPLSPRRSRGPRPSPPWSARLRMPAEEATLADAGARTLSAKNRPASMDGFEDVRRLVRACRGRYTCNCMLIDLSRSMFLLHVCIDTFSRTKSRMEGLECHHDEH